MTTRIVGEVTPGAMTRALCEVMERAQRFALRHDYRTHDGDCPSCGEARRLAADLERLRLVLGGGR